MKKEEPLKQEIAVYQDVDWAIVVDVKVDQKNVRLSTKQIASIFGCSTDNVWLHLKNIFKTHELAENQVAEDFSVTASDKKTYKVRHYNLDAIISVWYRVNSAKATKFRIWATNVLKEYLIQGYALNQKRLEETKLNELEQVVALIKKNLEHGDLSHTELTGLLELATHYTSSRILLQKYDEASLSLPTHQAECTAEIGYQEAMKAIHEMKTNFLFSQYVSELFGIERNHAFQGILESIYQQFDGQELYPSIEEKAAHLLFFIVRDHPFADGNKKIGAFLFLRFLAKNNCLYTSSGTKKIDDHTLVALTLLVASCESSQKEMMIKLIVNFITPPSPSSP